MMPCSLEEWDGSPGEGTCTAKFTGCKLDKIDFLYVQWNSGGFRLEMS